MASSVSAGPFVARVERDDSGTWLGTVPTLRGIHTHARSLASLRRYLQDAIALWLEVERLDAGEKDPHVSRHEIAVVLDVKLPTDVRRATETAMRRRERAHDAEEEAHAATRKAAHALSAVGLSRRDAAELLGLSHQRIDQLLHSA